MNAEIVQRHFGRQASLQSRQAMRALSGQAKAVVQFLEYRLDNLSQVSQPAAQPLRPTARAAVLLGCTNDVGPIGRGPARHIRIERKRLVSHVVALCRLADTGQTGVWTSACSQKGFGQDVSLVLAAPKPYPVMAPSGVTLISR